MGRTDRFKQFRFIKTEGFIMAKSEKVLVIMGGTSTEREVSLRSGRAVCKALIEAGYNAQTFDIQPDNIDEIKKINPDIAFLALHGKGGEDGKIQGLLEWMNIPYTGPGIASSAICIDKILTKKLMVQSGVKTPEFMTINQSEFEKKGSVCNEVAKKIGLPAVIKASCQGSSIGVVIVNKTEEIDKTIKELFSYGDEILIEQFVEGIEISVPVIGNDTLTVLPIIEITSSNEFYDYQAKYTKGMSRHIIPARISDDTKCKVEEIAKKAYKAALCRGLSRIDFIIDKNSEPYFIEINTIPGMTEVSLFPDSANHAGISFPELVDKIVKLGLEK